MDHQPSGLSFAVIGHQDEWSKVKDLVNMIRETDQREQLPLSKIKDVFGFIPPRKLFDIEVRSTQNRNIKGHYIETFIPPDELGPGHLRANIARVKEACKCAVRLGANIVSLGGFTSIVLEASGQSDVSTGDTYFTTGNTLTAVFIAKGVELVAQQMKMNIAELNLLIVGSTGDIGRACASYFAGRSRTLLLCARKAAPLIEQATTFQHQGINTLCSTDINELLPFADVIICVASSLLDSCKLSLLPEHSVIVDAGYPKNIAHLPGIGNRRVVAGGLGCVKAGFSFSPSYAKSIYMSDELNIAHGCVLESIVLALEGKRMAYSTGRGNITLSSMAAILAMAEKHGIGPSAHFSRIHC